MFVCVFFCVGFDCGESFGVGGGGGECVGEDEEGIGVCVIGCVGEGVVRFVRFVRGLRSFETLSKSMYALLFRFC
ncbi:MAG: hypothetical protein MW690_001645 [Methanophagales archaeon]|nr:hypothetical protein [Methanophagales archaeon]